MWSYERGMRRWHEQHRQRRGRYLQALSRAHRSPTTKSSQRGGGEIMIELDPEDIACCPICDNAIMDYEPAVIVSSGGAKCLAHEMCIDEEGDDD